LCPYSLSEVGHKCLDLIRGGVSGQVYVDLWSRLGAPGPTGDPIAHRPADEEQALASLLEALG
jgi:hypothetical protein